MTLLSRPALSLHKDNLFSIESKGSSVSSKFRTAFIALALDLEWVPHFPSFCQQKGERTTTPAVLSLQCGVHNITKNSFQQLNISLKLEKLN